LDEGFRFPTAKTQVIWLDENTLLIAAAVPGDTLDSSFPSQVRLWKRGTPYSDAKVVFALEPEDAYVRLEAVGVGKDRKGVIDIARHAENDFETFVVSKDGAVTPTNLPTASTYPGNLGLSGGTSRYVVTAAFEPVTMDGRSYPEGSVFAYDTSAATPPNRRISLVYAAPKGTYLDDAQFGFGFSGSHIYIVVRHNLARSLLVAGPGANGWNIKTLLTLAPGQSIRLWGGDVASDAIVVGQEGYLEPRSISLVEGEHCCIPLATDTAVFDASKFVTEIRTAKSQDGTLVDYYLVRPRNPKPGPVPTILSAYGVGVVIPPEYAANILDGGLVPWLNRGGAFAFAGIRGGAENGRAWNLAGIRRNKPKSWEDIAAVAEDLIKSGFTSSDRLGLTGRSYGGLMAAAVVVRYPDLFGAVLPGVPVADVFPIKGRSLGMLSHLGDTLGHPDDPIDRAVMLSYSPLQNIRYGVKYPQILTVCSTSDDRVGPGPARRFTAKLEAVGAKPLLIEGPTGAHLFPKSSTDPDAVTAEVMFFIDALMQPSPAQ
jgi:prolyl oligopeptidase